MPACLKAYGILWRTVMSNQVARIYIHSIPIPKAF